MDALGALNPLEVVEGEIQGKVGEFLTLKSTINQLRSSDQLNLASQAEGLMARQIMLEAELKTQLAAIEEMKSGAWDISSVLVLGNFAYDLSNQIKAVKALRQNALDNGGMPTVMPDVSIPVVLGVGALAAWFFLRK